jgi:hypothetical protein
MVEQDIFKKIKIMAALKLAGIKSQRFFLFLLDTN